MSFIWVFLGGGLGSVLRFSISKFIPYQGGFPSATLIANIVSSFILGYFMAKAMTNTLSESTQLFLMTGVCGGFSTFSTFSAENFLLWEEQAYSTLFLYITLSLLGGLGAIFLGYSIGK